MEAAARRELAEETHIEVATLAHVGSYLVDRWRYRNEIDKVMAAISEAGRFP